MKSCKIGFIPIASPSYANAKKDFYASVKEPLEGSPVALANQTEDHRAIYLMLFSLPKIVLSADVIEFNPPRGINEFRSRAQGDSRRSID